MQSPQYLLRITDVGPPNAPFGWQIICHEESAEIGHSATTFATWMEALGNSTRVAATIAFEETGDTFPLYFEGSGEVIPVVTKLAAYSASGKP